MKSFGLLFGERKKFEEASLTIVRITGRIMDGEEIVSCSLISHEVSPSAKISEVL